MKKMLFKLFVLFTVLIVTVSCASKSKDEGKKIKQEVTYYKFDDNFLAGMRNDMIAIAQKDYPNVELSNNDSQNSQAILKDQIDALISKVQIYQ